MLASASGVYAIRRRGDRAVEYVGESHTGRLWKTLQRHFQEGGGSFEDRSEYVRTSPAEYDAAAWITSKGAREKKRGDQGALDLQAALIERYAPTENRDDGRAYGPCPHGCSSWRCARAHLVPDVVRPGEAPAPDDDFPFGANEEPAEPAGAFDDLIAANPPARGGGMLPPNVLAACRSGDSRHVVSIVDAGPAHSLAVGEAPFSADDSRVIHALSLGWIRREPARGRWPERWVVTGAGSHALGTFDSDDPSFRDDAIDAGNEARRKKKAASSAAKPAGYGDEERGKKKAGQLRMFNPPARGKKRSTRAGLVVLGALVSIVYKPAGSNDAQPDPKTMRIPGAALAYEKKRGGRLVIVHAPRATGAAASSAARAEYARTHWGEPGRGQSLEGEILAGRDGVRRVGAVLQITYRTRKGASGKLVDYYHDFGEGSRRRLVLPLLESAKIGARTLYRLAGGSYTVERRGIVG